jgi:ribonuclease E
MTFTEAALEVLEREGRPMHAREIADKAVEWNLLSHVGKTPVQTMSARISAIVSKGRGVGPFIRVRPGVFALEKWGGSSPSGAAASQKQSPPKDVEATNKPEQQAGEGTPSTRKRRRRRKKRRPEEIPEANGKTLPEKKAPEQKKLPEKKTPEKKKAPEKKTPEKKMAHSLPPPADDNNEITDRVEGMLRQQTSPVKTANLVAHFGREGRRWVQLLEALLAADGIEREHRGLRPRFVEHRNGWALAAREVSTEIVDLESRVSEAAERLAQIAGRQVLRKIRSLPINAFVRVVILFLRRSGFGEMVSVDRGSGQEVHLSVQDRRRGGRFNTAVVVRRDSPGNPVDESAVTDLRGAMHHYDSMRGMIITTGAINDRARSEAMVPNLSPVVLVDGETFTRDLVKLGIGVRERNVNLPAFDDAFFTSLGSRDT